MQTAFGSGAFYGTPLYDAFGNAIATPTPIKLGILQDCSIDLSWDTKELHGQNQFPVDIGRGKGKMSGKAKYAQIGSAQFNTFIAGQTIATGQTLVSAATTPVAIPATPFTITPTVPGSGVFAADLGVRSGLTGVPLIRVASGPAAGQYSVNTTTGVYTFASADNVSGLTVFIDFRYTLTTGKTVNITNLPMGDIPTFMMELFLRKNGLATYIRIPNCVTSKFQLATKQDDFTIPDFDFMGFADVAGNAYYMSTSE